MVLTARTRLVLSRDRAVPYSKGMLAASLVAAGISHETAYRVARVVEFELRRDVDPLVSTRDLFVRTLTVLEREDGAEAVERFRSYDRVRHLDRPLLVAIGGAAGSGKSTVAVEVAHRLGIPRVVATDVVREVMRGVMAVDLVPEVQTSSFEAAGVAPADAANPVIGGFLRQAETVLTGVRAVAARAAAERFSLVLEGVHLLPDAPPLVSDPAVVVVPVMLHVPDTAVHEARFRLRAQDTADRRPAARYVASLKAIRTIQDHLITTARRCAIPVVDADGIDVAVRSVLDLVLAAARRAAAEPLEAAS